MSVFATKKFFIVLLGYSFVAPHLRKRKHGVDNIIVDRPEMNRPLLNDVFLVQRKVSFTILQMQFNK